MLNLSDIQRPSDKFLIIVAVVAGAVAFLFFGKATLADVFYFIAGIVGIAAFYKAIQHKKELEQTKKCIAERIEELEYRIDNLEKKNEE